MLSYYVNRDAYATLPDEYKTALEAACAESNVTMLAGYDVKNVAALETIRTAGVTLRPFPDDLMSAARDASLALMSDQAAADPAYRKVHASFAKWQKESALWFAQAEETYTDFVFAGGGEKKSGGNREKGTGSDGEDSSTQSVR